jgi:hypothetical protein
MYIRVNDDTIPKKTMNMKLKRQYTRKSYMEGKYETGDTLLPGSPHKSRSNKEATS